MYMTIKSKVMEEDHKIALRLPKAFNKTQLAPFYEPTHDLLNVSFTG